ncbi:MAG: hypothetical protein Q7U02_11375, partial [Desulfosalsimonadaceae bacterium]|nr:hypothetical protein [Desulfosalsimonadaceae bacterium]
KKTPDDITHFFSGHPVTIKKGVDLPAAEKYAAAFKKAGAVCSVVRTAKSIRMITPCDAAGGIRFHMQKCPFLSSAFNGLNFNRMDMENIPFGNILSLSVFSSPTPAGQSLNVVFFLKSFLRPFAADPEKIKYREFPDIIGSTVTDSLRNFIWFLFEQNSALVVDVNTHEYLTGNQEVMKVHNPDRYVNAIGVALGNEGFLGMTSGSPAVDHSASGVPSAPPQDMAHNINPSARAIQMPGLPGSAPPSQSQMQHSQAVPFNNNQSSHAPAYQPSGGGDPDKTLLFEAQQLFSKGETEKAVRTMEQYLALYPDDWDAHHEMADNLCTQADSKDKRIYAQKALVHAQKAFEIKAFTEANVVDTLANAFALNNKVEDGLKLLEEAFGNAAEPKEKKNWEDRIDAFRKKQNLGRLWRFYDHQGKIIFESDNIKLIKHKLIINAIPENAFCQCNGVGNPSPVKELLVAKESVIDMLFNPVTFHVKMGACILGGITGSGTALFYVVKFCIWYGRQLPDAFSEWLNWGLQNLVGFVAAIVLLGLPSLAIGLGILAIVIAAIGVGTGLVGFIPGGAVGALIGWIVGVIRAPSLPKVGGSGNPKIGQ